jgi:chitodextrinase
MKTLHTTFCFTVLIFCLNFFNANGQPIIIDHNCCDIAQIPQSAIENAKTTLDIGYDHSSHGSQIVTGMDSLRYFMNSLGYPADLYRFVYNASGTGHLCIRNNVLTSAPTDLGNPNWASETRVFLDANPSVNVLMLAWCGQVSYYTESQIDDYLNSMNSLENDYSGVKFVYMTGHLDGTGETGTLHIRNVQIRDYCIANNKILYDFADIESYDPEGLINYMPLLVNDNCDYDSDGDGIRDANWALDWQNSHVEDQDWFSCLSAHSIALNANRKAYTAWWLWARLAGWNPVTDTTPPSVPQNLTNGAITTFTIELSWDSSTDSESGINRYLIYRNGVVAGNSFTNQYTDDGLIPGSSYNYQVSAVNGVNLESGLSSSVSVTTLADTELPSTPAGLSGFAVSSARISLDWNASTDNVGISGYKIYRNGSEIAAVSNTSYTDDGLSPLTTYSYAVSAYDAADNESPLSASVDVTTLDPSSFEAGNVYTVISDQDFIIHENCTNSDDVGQIKTHTNVTLSNVYFEFIGGDVSPFSLNNITGQITVSDAASIDYDASDLLSCEVRLTCTWKDYAVEDTFTVDVQVLDDASIVFIDPDHPTDGTGTIGDPKNMLTLPILENNKNYLFKRSTTAEFPSTFTISTQNNILGSYGIGERAHVKINGSLHNYLFQLQTNYDNITFRDLEMSSDNWAITAIHDNAYHVSNNLQIKHCYIHHVNKALYIMTSDKNHVKILYNHFRDIKEDGMFCTKVIDIEIAYNIIEHVNQNWDYVGQDAGSNCIRIGTADEVHVHHNFLDRSHSGNKYVIEYAGTNDEYTCRIERNYIIGPSTDGGFSAAIYMLTSQTTIRNNIITNGAIGITMGGGDSTHQIIGNEFTNLTKAINSNHSKIYNNIFYNNRGGVSSNNSTELRNNIFHLTQSGDVAIYPSNNIDSDYNCYNTEQSGMFSHLHTLTDFQQSYSCDFNSIIGDPLFLDGSNNDFRIQNGSPCIDAGVSVNLDYDMDGVPIPQENGVDIGAYEYQDLTPVDSEAPTVPQNVSAFVLSQSSVRLTWDASTDNVSVEGYHIYREGVPVTTTAVTEYTDTGLQESTTYHYTVSAYDATGNESDPSSTVAVTTLPATEQTADLDVHTLVSDQQFIVHENCSNDDDVGIIHLHPNMVISNIQFTAISGDVALFNINSATGAIRVTNAGSINYDVDEHLSIDVAVSGTFENRSIIDTLTVHVKVLDDANTIFIDPEAPVNGTGTITDPRNTLTGLLYQNNHNYLIKRSKTLVLDYSIYFQDLSGILLAGYGQGDRPHIMIDDPSKRRTVSISSGVSNITIWDIEFSSNGWAETGIMLAPAETVTINGLNVINCEIHDFYTGIGGYLGPKHDMKLMYNELHELRDDGIMIYPGKQVEIAYNTVYRVNLNWDLVGHSQAEAAGDCIQIADMDSVIVHHNNLDRSNAGNKFCFINFGHNDDFFCIFEHNYLIGPRKDGDGGAAIYLNSSSNIIRYNKIKGGVIGIAIDGTSSLDKIYGNVISGTDRIINSENTEIFNNVFYNNKEGINAGNHAVVRNNIFYLIRPGDIAMYPSQNLDSDYNLFNVEQAGMFSHLNTLAELQGQGNDLHSIIADPQCADTSHFDFRLTSTSPAIDAGVAVGMTQDMNGIPVPVGAGPDIGAYEYNGENPNGDLMLTMSDINCMQGQTQHLEFSIQNYLSHNSAIAGVELHLTNGSPEYLTISDAVTAAKTSEFSINTGISADKMIVTLHNNSGNSIPYGSGPICLLPITVSDIAPLDSCYSLTLTKVILGDSSGNAVAVFIPDSSASICVNCRVCDSNEDGESNILDIIQMVNCALNNTVCSNSADYNSDEEINILDIVGCINKITHNFGSPKTLNTKVTVEPDILIENEQTYLILKIFGREDIQGCQFNLTGDFFELRISEMNDNHIDIYSKIDEHKMSVIVFSMDKDKLPLRNNQISIPIQIGENVTMDCLSVEELIIADTQANTVDYEMSNSTVTNIENDVDNLPKTIQLYPNYPNPANPGTTIKFYLPEKSRIKVIVYSITGAIVRILDNQQMEAGMHEIYWDGKNDHNKQVSSGTYIYKFEVKGKNYVTHRKIVLLK